MEHFKNDVLRYLDHAGVTLNGNQPSDIHVHDSRFFKRVITQGSMGLGESYMEGWWECQKLDEFMHRLIRAELNATNFFSWKLFLSLAKNLFLNMQSKQKARIVGKKHYDLGNDLFEHMLDKRMTYSCAYWKNAANLDEAQEHKLDLICKKLDLKPGMRVLDIGCGWGSFAKYAAANYGCQVVGITISQKQLELAQELCQGLPIELRLQDYREVNETFDRIVSVGQLEHVGYKNYRLYMKIVHRCFA